MAKINILINVEPKLALAKKYSELLTPQFSRNINLWLGSANKFLLKSSQKHKSTKQYRELLQKLQFSQNINVVLVGKSSAIKYNQQFRSKDYAANVLSFAVEFPEINILQADLIICAPIVLEEARKFCQTISARFAHLIIHGYLHTLGLDHQTMVEQEFMENLEINISENLGFNNPYIFNNS